MRLSDVMRQAQAIIDDVCKGREMVLPDKGTDRLLTDLDQPSILAESDRLTGELFPDRAARVAAEANARACEKPSPGPRLIRGMNELRDAVRSGVPLEDQFTMRTAYQQGEDPEPFDEFTGGFPDESGASAGIGGDAHV